jgi:hypothetical protein
MQEEDMTTQELAELFLTALNDLAEAAPHPNFLFNMNEFAPSVGISDFAELARAVNLLESKGLVYLSSFDAMGGVSAGITPDGSEFVEKGGETGIIAEYRKNPRSFYQITQNIGPIVPSMEDPIIKDMGPEWMSQANPIQEKPKVAEPPARPSPAVRNGVDPAMDGLLLAVSILIEKDTSLTKASRDDLLKDVETLRIQVQRNTLNKEVVVSLLDSLSALQGLVPLLTHIAQAL